MISRLIAGGESWERMRDDIEAHGEQARHIHISVSPVQDAMLTALTRERPRQVRSKERAAAGTCCWNSQLLEMAAARNSQLLEVAAAGVATNRFC